MYVQHSSYYAKQNKNHLLKEAEYVEKMRRQSRGSSYPGVASLVVLTAVAWFGYKSMQYR
jgi:hypothetical protein